MYLLVFVQNNEQTPIGIFDSIENGRKFVRKIPTYNFSIQSGIEFDIEIETINPVDVPKYLEIEYKGNRVPITRYMFRDDDLVDIVWKELPNMEIPNRGLVDAGTLVDAYIIGNHDVKEYIEKREDLYSQILKILDDNGYVGDRNFFGSEDGEAIVYRKKEEEDWHFLIHMDPLFVKDTPKNRKDLEKWVIDQLD